MTGTNAREGERTPATGARDDPLFDLSELPEPERAILERFSTRVTAPAGTNLIEAGKREDCLYLLLSGEVEVSVATGEEDLTLTRARRGQFLGELTWFTNEPRTATARATATVEALAIERRALDRLRVEAPSLACRLLYRLAVTLALRVDRLARQRYWLANDEALADGLHPGEGVDQSYIALPMPPTRSTAFDAGQARYDFEDAAWLRGIPPAVTELLIEFGRPANVHAGEVLWTQGEAGESLLLPVTAGLEAVAAFPDHPEVRLGLLEPGDIAGEVSVFGRSPRSATVRVVIGGVILVIARDDLMRAMAVRPGEMADLLLYLCQQLSQRVVASTHALAESIEPGGDQEQERRRWLLAQLALRPRWSQDDIAWKSHRRASARLEMVVARFIRDLELAESSAEWLAAGLVESAGQLVPPEYYRAFYIRQHDEEHLHATTLARYGELLGGADAASSGFTMLLREARRERSLEQRILLLYLGEELAFLTFRLLAQTYPDPLLRSILTYIAVDESTHVAFGQRLMKRLLARRSRKQRIRLVSGLLFSRLLPAIMLAFWEYRGLARVSGFRLACLYLLYGRAQVRRAWSIAARGDLERISQ